LEDGGAARNLVTVRVEIHHPPPHLPWKSVEAIYKDIWSAKDIIGRGNIQYAYDRGIERGFEAYVVTMSKEDLKRLEELARRNRFYIVLKER